VAAVEAQQAARRAAGDLRSARVAADGDAVFRDV
jgi:hypothetical protein